MRSFWSYLGDIMPWETTTIQSRQDNKRDRPFRCENMGHFSRKRTKSCWGACWRRRNTDWAVEDSNNNKCQLRQLDSCNHVGSNWHGYLSYFVKNLYRFCLPLLCNVTSTEILSMVIISKLWNVKRMSLKGIATWPKIHNVSAIVCGIFISC